MISFTLTKSRNVVAAAGLSVLAACATPPPPPPPPPPPVVAVPSRPLPPFGAAANTFIPPVGVDGLRQTVNSHVSSAQRIWNFRSAYNVAALNCLQVQYGGILDGYKSYLTKYKRDLDRINKTVEGEWRKAEGTGYMRARDSYTTQVYNYWALPPVLPRFCDAVAQIAQQEQLTPSPSVDVMSETGLARLEGIFGDFYSAFEQYRVDSAAWDAKYGATYGYSQMQYTNAAYAPPVYINPPPVASAPQAAVSACPANAGSAQGATTTDIC